MITLEAELVARRRTGTVVVDPEDPERTLLLDPGESITVKGEVDVRPGESDEQAIRRWLRELRRRFLGTYMTVESYQANV